MAQNKWCMCSSIQRFQWCKWSPLQIFLIYIFFYNFLNPTTILRSRPRRPLAKVWAMVLCGIPRASVYMFPIIFICGIFIELYSWNLLSNVIFYRPEDVLEQLNSVSKGQDYLIRLCDTVNLDILSSVQKISWWKL